MTLRYRIDENGIVTCHDDRHPEIAAVRIPTKRKNRRKWLERFRERERAAQSTLPESTHT